MKLIRKFDNVAHVDVREVLFLRELEAKSKALARCYSLANHPIGFFTAKKFCIVFYWALCDYMTKAQLTLLVLHEMMHIPPVGDKLIDHDIQDFRSILGVDLDWSEPGQKIPNILSASYGS